jgi:hypothetical protein
VYFIVYVSSAVTPFSKPELLDLLTVARVNNTNLNVTGMLVYKDGDFMQVLEGEEATVRALYAKIGRDRRHRRTMVLLQGELQERSFPDWSMGFHEIGAGEKIAIPGYSEFLNTPLTGEEFFQDPARSQKLLLSFKQTVR